MVFEGFSYISGFGPQTHGLKDKRINSDWTRALSTVSWGSCFLSDSSAAYLTGPVQVLLILREVVEREEGVGIPRSAMAQPVPLPQQSVLPDQVGTLTGVVEILLPSEHLQSQGEVLLQGI